jgi:hypothetical protein
MKDKLFLLKPGFMDQDQGPYFCPGCAQVEGMLSYCPELRDKVEVVYIDFPRPRPAIAELIGEANQGCPKLVLAAAPTTIPEGVGLRQSQGNFFVDDAREVCLYLAHVFGVSKPH